MPGDDPLHLGVFRLELLEPYEVAGLQSGVLIAPVADCARVTPCFRASFVAGTAGELLENSDDLRFAEATLFHVSLLSPKGQTHNFNLRRFPPHVNPVTPASQCVYARSLRARRLH